VAARQTYGRWEVRARTEAGAGYRPAILLWPDTEDWPAGGEIDFLDSPHPDRTETNFVVHYGPQNAQDGVTTSGDFTDWHTYARRVGPPTTSPVRRRAGRSSARPTRG
jgi:beta-glucanase (GH16 family)